MSIDSYFITIDIENDNHEVLHTQVVPGALQARVLISWGYQPGVPNQYRFTIKNYRDEVIERI